LIPRRRGATAKQQHTGEDPKESTGKNIKKKGCHGLLKKLGMNGKRPLSVKRKSRWIRSVYPPFDLDLRRGCAAYELPLFIEKLKTLTLVGYYFESFQLG
jgi:hypothetical protein